jgi:hypothetical protein
MQHEDLILATLYTPNGPPPFRYIIRALEAIAPIAGHLTNEELETAIFDKAHQMVHEESAFIKMKRSEQWPVK